MTALPAPTVRIRPESAADHGAVATVVAAAFAPDGQVAGLVDALRRSPAFVPALSLVATLEGDVVGHVLLTTAELVDEHDLRHPVLVLSPLSVLPARQRRGIGAALVREALGRADRTGEQLVVLQGSPRYYPRFGFRDGRTLGVAMSQPFLDLAS